LIGGEKWGELVGAEGAERHAKKTEKTCDLSSKLHKQGMMAAHTGLFNPWQFAGLGRERRERLDPLGATNAAPQANCLTGALRRNPS